MASLYATVGDRHQEFGRIYDSFLQVQGQWESAPYPYWRISSPSHVIRLEEWLDVYALGPTSHVADQHEATVWDAFIDSLLEGEAPEPISPNAISCVVWLLVGPVSILLLGDSTTTALEEALAAYEVFAASIVGRPIASHLVKVSHHGSATGSSAALWAKILRDEGSIIVISAGGGRGAYALPSPQVIEHIAASGKPVEVYCTNMCPMVKASLVGRWEPRNSSKPSAMT